jgi:hypothetical protein
MSRFVTAVKARSSSHTVTAQPPSPIGLTWSCTANKSFSYSQSRSSKELAILFIM